jgi:hypothetical protein
MSQQEWTVERVIKEAAKKTGWFIDRYRCIRRKQSIYGSRHIGYQCPICAAVDFGLESYKDVARIYGIPSSIADAVANASDACIDNHSKKIRAAMLDAFGLWE